MKLSIKRFGLVCLAGLLSHSVNAFTISMTADSAPVGANAVSDNCQLGGEEVFSGNAGGTFYTADEAYSGSKSIELNVNQGDRGFGYFGGTVKFEHCAHVGGRRLVKGDEVWIRLRMFFPEEFQFNPHGRQKFLRLRAYNGEGDLRRSEGYNDLYINSPTGSAPNQDYTPWHYIFEGAPNWYKAGTEQDFFTLGQWHTVEFYLRLDNKTASQGGSSMVRFWFDGRLVGETGERVTLETAESYLEYFYLFTWWSNHGSPQTQKLYVDDLVVTTDTPKLKDDQGNPYVGLGANPSAAAAPRAPQGVNIFRELH